MKYSPLIWHLQIKSTVKILSFFVAFLENMNFKQVLFCISYGLQMTAICMVDSFKINFINHVD